MNNTIETERLILRKWKESDAEELYKYAKDPNIGPICGWPPHRNITESLNTIKNVLQGKECYAICLKENDKPIGCCELMLNGHSDLFDTDDQAEIGYWLGKPFWGNGYMPEAVKALLKRAFETLGMEKVWCAYYDGNEKSKRVQEKCGFIYHHTKNDNWVPLMQELRTDHVNLLTKEDWEKIK